MKKAKIVLTAIAILAVAGGALAFKAKKFTGGTYYVSAQTTPHATSTLTGLFTNAASQPLLYYTTEFDAPLITSSPRTRFTIVP